jgi:hypothetical protein
MRKAPLIVLLAFACSQGCGGSIAGNAPDAAQPDAGLDASPTAPDATSASDSGPPVDATSPRRDSAAGAGDGADARASGQIVCGATTCNAANQVCCAAAGALSCTPLNECAGGVYSCSGPQSCPQGGACCAVMDQSALWGSRCTSAAEGCHAELCTAGSASPCSNGAPCNPAVAPAPYGLCYDNDPPDTGPAD